MLAGKNYINTAGEKNKLNEKNRTKLQPTDYAPAIQICSPEVMQQLNHPEKNKIIVSSMT